MKLSQVPIKSDWLGARVIVRKSTTLRQGTQEFEGVVVDFKKRVLVAFPQSKYSCPQWCDPDFLEVIELREGVEL
jgi:hypothetical protein